MTIYASFIIAEYGYSISYISLSPDNFSEDELVYKAEIDEYLTDCELGEDGKSDCWIPWNGSIDVYDDESDTVITNTYKNGELISSVKDNYEEN